MATIYPLGGDKYDIIIDKGIYKEILSSIGYVGLLDNFMECEVEFKNWLEIDSLLADSWLKELGISKIGPRLKFMKLLKEKSDSIDKANQDKVKCDDGKIYLKEYDQIIEYIPTILWPTAKQYKEMIYNTDPIEAMDDLKQTNGTIGVVVSLLLSMVYLKSGFDTTFAEDNIWGDYITTGQNILSVCLAIDSAMCVCIILFTTRVYIALSMLPNSCGRLAQCYIGGDFCLSYALFAFQAFSWAFGITLGLWISISMSTYYCIASILVVAAMIIIQILMCGFNQCWPGGTVDMRFEKVLRFLYPQTTESWMNRNID